MQIGCFQAFFICIMNQIATHQSYSPKSRKRIQNANTLHLAALNLHRQLNQMQTSRSDYQVKLQQVEWLLKRKAILQRDNYHCQCCGSQLGLQVHHRQYHKFRVSGIFKNPWNYPDQLLITLCRDCHQKGHAIYKVPSFIIKN